MKLSWALFVVCLANYSCFHEIWADDTPEIFTGQLDEPGRAHIIQVPRETITYLPSGDGTEPLPSEGSRYFFPGYLQTPGQTLEPVEAVPIIVPGLPQEITEDWEYLGHFGRWARETAYFVFYLMWTRVKEMLNLSAPEPTVIDTFWIQKKMETNIDSLVIAVQNLPLRLVSAVFTLVDPRLVGRFVISVFNFIMEMAKKLLHFLTRAPFTGVFIFVDALLFVYVVKILLRRATFSHQQ
uniref:Vesicular inhibitory amino acid transporter n=1 Tax=Lygus hesperus TaxID=30085 RepID=A0A0A9Y7L0_LYGHE